MKGWLRVPVAALTAVGLHASMLSPALAAGQAPGSLEGRILATGGEPVEGAVVLVRSLRDASEHASPPTGTDGAYALYNWELFFHALSKKLYKIEVELMDTQASAMAAAERLGFRKEATLHKHVTDVRGIRRDLVIMTLDVEDLWYLMEDHIKTRDFRLH